MNTKKRLRNLRNLSPDYPRIPHLSKDISNMTHDDIQLETNIQFPLTAWVQEKLDGANMGISWISGPVLRNRNHILKKGYIEKETPAKLQFRPAWNWLHAHDKEIRQISNECMSPITIYGEWCYAKHSIEYNKLPDLFMAYDIYSLEDREFLSPDVVERLLSKTTIKYIKPHKVIFNNINEIVQYSEMNSDYKDGIREGIVLKISNDRFVTKSFKVVNKYFMRRENFNDVDIIKNKTL
jgi:atypical dual specificity phosphatase